MKKKNLNFANWMAFIVLILGIFVSSCTKDEAVKPNNENAVNLKKKLDVPSYDYWILTDDFKIPSNATVCNLIGGQYIETGEVSYWNTEVEGKKYLYVKYSTDGSWLLHEVHLFVGDQVDMPLNKKGTPKIGHFPYSDDELGGVSFITIKIDVTQLDDCFTIAAHGVVMDGDRDETVWSKCSPVITLKTFAEIAGDAGWTFAVNDGDELIGEGSSKWCKDMGIIYTEMGIDKTFDLLDYDQANVVGSVHVFDNGSELVVEITAFKKGDIDINLRHTKLFVGTKYGLDLLYGSDIYAGECPAYYDFPYYENDISPVHTFFLPNYFSTEFSSSRWGWFSKYCIQ